MTHAKGGRDRKYRTASSLVGWLISICNFHSKSDRRDTELAFHIRSMFFKGGSSVVHRQGPVQEDRLFWLQGMQMCWQLPIIPTSDHSQFDEEARAKKQSCRRQRQSDGAQIKSHAALHLSAFSSLTASISVIRRHPRDWNYVVPWIIQFRDATHALLFALLVGEP
jgi:hypothetical protein